MKWKLLPTWAQACALISAAATAAHGQLTVTEVMGGPFATNLATLETSSAFGKDEILGGTLPPHKIFQVRDGIYGNANSWIGDSTNSFIGISLGATPVSIGQIAFGRDNTGTYFDRSAGTFTLQYTTVPNPNETTPASAWITIGTITHEAGPNGQPRDAGILAASRRHAFNFPTVQATGVRIITPGSGLADGAAIDEIEVAAFAPAPLTLQTTSGGMDFGTNIALATNGGIPFAKDLLGGGNYAPTHTIGNLNDGIYGNSNSWIGDSEDSFAGVSFATPNTIAKIAFGRDNTGTYSDRASGYYLVQYTKDPAPDSSTPDSSWIDIGPVFIDGADTSKGLRHEYSFAPVAGATAVRIITPGNGIGTGAAIDELEVYAVPEPTSGVLTLLGATIIGSRPGRRNRSA